MFEEERLSQGDQPCKEFRAAEVSLFHGGALAHQCPKCEGLRYFCKNCHTDHHQGGWESCKQPPDEPPERCEGGCDGPVVAHDSEGIPLCQDCYDMLKAEAMADKQDNWTRDRE